MKLTAPPSCQDNNGAQSDVMEHKEEEARQNPREPWKPDGVRPTETPETGDFEFRCVALLRLGFFNRFGFFDFSAA